MTLLVQRRFRFRFEFWLSRFFFKHRSQFEFRAQMTGIDRLKVILARLIGVLLDAIAFLIQHAKPVPGARRAFFRGGIEILKCEIQGSVGNLIAIV